MAEIYGRLTGQPGVCSRDPRPGRHQPPARRGRRHHQQHAVGGALGPGRPEPHLQGVAPERRPGVDVRARSPSGPTLVRRPGAAPEMVRKAFKLAQTERPGAVYLAVPEDVESADAPSGSTPLTSTSPAPTSRRPPRSRGPPTCSHWPDARSCSPATAPPGPGDAGAVSASPRRSACRSPPRSTARASSPTTTRNALGAVGFMRHDYVNFGFDEADVDHRVGYELQEFDPVRINPDGDKQILHIHRFPAEVDDHYDVEVGIQADIARTPRRARRRPCAAASTRRHRGEDPPAARRGTRRRRADDGFPLTPARIVADTRAALGRDDIVLADTGAREDVDGPAVPDLRAQHLPDLQRPVDHGLCAARRHRAPSCAGPDANVLAATGDGSFLMNSQEIETALRDRHPDRRS